MTRSEARTWAVAATVSLLVHGALLWQVGMAEGEAGKGTPSPTVTRVRFNSNSSAPSQMAAVTPPEPQPKRPAEKQPAVAKAPIPAEQPEQASDEPTSLSQMSGSENAMAELPGASSLAEARQSYTSQLMAHIERRKFYPETARRRGVTGGVRVGFVVAQGGDAAGLECSQGPSVLTQAACDAVRRAVPLPLPPPELGLPLAVSFVMEYSLK